MMAVTCLIYSIAFFCFNVGFRVFQNERKFKEEIMALKASYEDYGEEENGNQEDQEYGEENDKDYGDEGECEKERDLTTY